MIRIVQALLFFTTIAALLYSFSFFIKANAEDASYVGSEACRACHEEIHVEWGDSLHHKMMRSVDDEDALVADFDAEESPFNVEDTAWVIGSKWQQQFMGHEDDQDILLPGVWNVASQQWQVTGWDGWKVPDPVKRCHGCHTVGLNIATGEFVEPGIGCESCHGPGSWHVQTKGRSSLNIGVDAALCGQCHSRGMAIDDKAFFPHSYRPGDELEHHFKPLEADFIQNSSQWWGTGREKKRHQEYTAWSRGGHVDALETLFTSDHSSYGEPSDECLRCHAGEAAIRGESHGLWLEQAEHGVTCAVCHFSHGQLDQIRQDCKDCHDRGAFHHDRQSIESHVPCPVSANVQCIDCHMPLTVKMGGEFVLRSHAPGITEPIEGANYEAPSSCANGLCHQKTDPLWLQQQFEAFYRTDSVE